MLRAIFSFVLLRIRHVYDRGNKWIVYTLVANSMKSLLKLKMLQSFGLSNNISIKKSRSVTDKL